MNLKEKQILKTLLRELKDIEERATSQIMEAVNTAKIDAIGIDSLSLFEQLEVLVAESEDPFLVRDVEELL